MGRCELTRAGKAVHLERIPLDLLILLVRENGRLISREEIIERLWGKNLHFDTDNSINTAVRKIRHALKDDSAKPQFVETVPGKGYRFQSRTIVSSRVPPHSETDTPRIMLAVLPFDNLSGDPAQEYFTDGMTEETIMHLGQMKPQRLGVIARTSSMIYKRTTKSVAQIGRELGVDYVLEGSMRRDADHVRVTAQLIRVHDQIHLWASNYDRQMPGILEIHGSIASAIAAQVRHNLLPEQDRQASVTPPRDAIAHDHYLRGRYHYSKTEMLKAITCFTNATARNEDHVMAHSGLADALVALPIAVDANPKDVSGRVKAAVAQALKLDPQSAEAHASDAAMKFWLDWDFPGSEAAARRAIDLNENYSLAHLYLAHVLSNVGRHDEALDAIRQSLILDPLSLITGALHGQFLYQAGKDQEAIEQFKRVLGMEPHFWVGQICLAKVLEKQGLYSEALIACHDAWEHSGNTEALSIAGYVHAVSGNKAEAESSLENLLKIKKERYIPAFNVALIFVGLGSDEEALNWLELAYDEGDVHMPFLVDQKLKRLSSNPRYQKLRVKVGFPNS